MLHRRLLSRTARSSMKAWLMPVCTADTQNVTAGIYPVAASWLEAQQVSHLNIQDSMLLPC